jgi:putative flavoprotein involved in K+ transport
MKHTDTVIIGGGQAGLAMSTCLARQGIDHVVLERGRVGQRWFHERWDSLHLLTPNWQTRLPGWHYRGADPDGFMSAVAFGDHLARYARAYTAPVHTDTPVRELHPEEGGFRVLTPTGDWLAGNVVIATGHCDVPRVPRFMPQLSPRLEHVVPSRYRHPGELPEGGVLVVGASATGVQLADELHRSGRPVTLAVGRHIRLPRRYRGRDIFAWMDQAGILTERAEDVRDLEASRRQPSLQLVGRPDHSTLDLPTLAAAGVRLVGRVVNGRGDRLRLSADLGRMMVAAEAKCRRTLGRIDRHIEQLGFSAEREDGPARPPSPAHSPAELDLAESGIRTVVWATGYSRDYSWLKAPVFDARGEIAHDGGLTQVPGLYVLGLPFLRRRNSHFIDGVGADAEVLAAHITRRLAAPRSAAA